MAEEFEKYKSILDRERKEFKQQLKREVSAFLSFQVDQRSNIGTEHSCYLVTNLPVLLFIFSKIHGLLSLM